jgi:hypothetical protein
MKRQKSYKSEGVIMRKITGILIFCVLILGGCSDQVQLPPNQLEAVTVTPTIGIQESATAITPSDNIYRIDVQKDWDEAEYKKVSGMDLNYFSSPISSPYQYTYLCEEGNMTIEEIAKALGEVMMKDLMQDYEGKTFTVTEYHNLVADVMSEEECSEWESTYFRMLGKKLEIMENQWLCSFSCEYKYTGTYANVGEMPADWEWMTMLTEDGSGEEYVFIIQKNDASEYILRAMPKAVKEIR